MRNILSFILVLFMCSMISYGQGQGLDLPIEPPRLGDKKKTITEVPPLDIPPETPDDDNGDDPRDTPPPEIYGEEIETETDTIFYVLDISGSMNNGYEPMLDPNNNKTRGSKYYKAVSELIRSIRALSKNISFNIARYDCATEVWESSFLEASEENKKKAEAWILADTEGKRTPRDVPGATGTGPAMTVALGFKNNDSVVLLTDGAPNCGAPGLEGHRIVIARANTHGATINVFGIEAINEFRTFCQQVASDSGGQYFDVP